MSKDEFTKTSDDQIEISESLSVLRQIRSPPEARASYRASIDSELFKVRATQLSMMPWWRRSVAVPIPLIVATCILLLVSTWVALGSRPSDTNAARADKQPLAFNGPGDTIASPKMNPLDTFPTGTSELAASVSTTYLCGVGPLSTEMQYVYKESDL
ncbi:MAG: hypothetical protein KDA86_16860 [Planctomycetaceae bacterium]|nr:hypothetical protein [Planctomycetaceae bacterium]